MIRVLLLIVLFLSISFCDSYARNDSTKIAVSIGTGFGTSNVKRDFTNKPHPGLDTRISFYLLPSLRVSAEYNRMFEHSIKPYWEGVRSDVYELNLQYLAHVTGYSSAFYIIAGYAVQDWKGTFVGEGFEHETGQFSSTDASFTARFPKLSVGFGMQRSFKQFDLFADFRYRINHSEPKIPLNIVDVNYGIGIRYRLKSSSLKKLYRVVMPPERYHWF